MDSDISAEILSDNNDISLTILRSNSKILLSALLNPIKVLPNEDGIPRDWRGLAHFVGLTCDQIVSNDPDPTATVLKIWQKQSIPFTLKVLKQFLEKLDRYDIIDDTKELIESDIKLYSNMQKDETTTKNDNLDLDARILTIHDPVRLSQGLGPQTYDAFVAFSSIDIDFATELIDKMEKDFSLRLCAKERDLVAGLHFEYSAIIELIAKRCNRLIAIISPAFINSPADKFVMNYAQAVGIEQKCRKIIPCVYKSCKMPPELENIFYLDYERLIQRNLFWEKLRRSIEVPTIPSISISQPEISKPIIQEIPTNCYDRLPEVTKKKHLRHNHHVKFESNENLTVTNLSESQHTVSTPALYTSSSSMERIHTIPDNVPNKKISFLPKFFKKLKKGEDKHKVHDNKNKKKHSKLKILSLF